MTTDRQSSLSRALRYREPLKASVGPDLFAGALGCHHRVRGFARRLKSGYLTLIWVALVVFAFGSVSLRTPLRNVASALSTLISVGKAKDRCIAP